MSSTTPRCGYCGCWHDAACPRIESIAYHPNGAIQRVTLRPPVGTPLGVDDAVIPIAWGEAAAAGLQRRRPRPTLDALGDAAAVLGAIWPLVIQTRDAAERPA